MRVVLAPRLVRAEGVAVVAVGAVPASAGRRLLATRSKAPRFCGMGVSGAMSAGRAGGSVSLAQCAAARGLARKPWQAAHEWSSCVVVAQLRHRLLSTATDTNSSDRDALRAYHQLADATLEELAEQLDELPDVCDVLADDNSFDVNLANGVLTLKLGADRGTYVINKQVGNRARGALAASPFTWSTLT